jgi:hypothetical protein
MKRMALCLLLPCLASCTTNNGEAGAGSYRVLNTVAVGAQSVQVYVANRDDVVVLGVSTRDRGEKQSYCPLYVSIEGLIPAVTLTVSVIESRQAVRVESSWPEAAVLGGYQLGGTHCTTMYGAKPLIDDAIPQDFGGSLIPVRVPDKDSITKTVTIHYPEPAN